MDKIMFSASAHVVSHEKISSKPRVDTFSHNFQAQLENVNDNAQYAQTVHNAQYTQENTPVTDENSASEVINDENLLFTDVADEQIEETAPFYYLNQNIGLQNNFSLENEFGVFLANNDMSDVVEGENFDSLLPFYDMINDSEIMMPLNEYVDLIHTNESSFESLEQLSLLSRKLPNEEQFLFTHSMTPKNELLSGIPVQAIAPTLQNESNSVVFPMIGMDDMSSDIPAVSEQGHNFMLEDVLQNMGETVAFNTVVNNSSKVAPLDVMIPNQSVITIELESVSTAELQLLPNSTESSFDFTGDSEGEAKNFFTAMGTMNIQTPDMDSPRIIMSNFANNLREHLLQNGNANIVRNAQFVLHNARAGEVKLVLYPENLGNVRIHLQLNNNNGMTGQIIVRNDIVKEIFELNLDALQKQFQDKGIEVMSLEVSIQQEDTHQEQNFLQKHIKKDNKAYENEPIHEDTGSIVNDIGSGQVNIVI